MIDTGNPARSRGARRLRTPLCLLAALLLAGCTAAYHREQVELAADAILDAAQREALGRAEPFTVVPPEEALRRKLLLDQELPRTGPASLGVRDLDPIDHWPEDGDLVSEAPATTPGEDAATIVTLSVLEALEVAAAGNRGYQARKEDIYRAALDLEFERDQFRPVLGGAGDGRGLLDRTSSDQPDGVVSGFDSTSTLSFTQRLKNGISLATAIGIDLARMLQPGRAFSSALSGDASITIPLLRGSGRHIVAEALTQAERDVLYAIWQFERFKAELAVDVFDGYAGVLADADQVANAEENYRGLITSSRRAQRLADAGKLGQIQVDQAMQDELRARDRWIRAREGYSRSLDLFKIQLGLPTDARVELDRGELQRLAEDMKEALPALYRPVARGVAPAADVPVVLELPNPAQAGRYELDPRDAARLALARRPDLIVAVGQVYDAQRAVVIAADALRAELTLLGSVAVGEQRSVGSAGLPDANRLDLDRGLYESLLTIDLPLERTAEALAYRASYLGLQRAVRDVQELEDQVKLQVRDQLRNLRQARASLAIQVEAVRLAERRVRGAQLELEAGRAEIRDLLEAQEALINSQNGLTQALVSYRVGELSMQRDLGVLLVDGKGLWQEADPRELLEALEESGQE